MLKVRRSETHGSWLAKCPAWQWAQVCDFSIQRSQCSTSVLRLPQSEARERQQVL